MGNISIRNIIDGSWAVELTVEQTDLDDIELVKILHKAKGEVSHLTGLPISSLHYKDLVKKRFGADSHRISMIISDDSSQTRDPIIKCTSLTTDDGIEYEDMLLSISLYPLNKNGERTSIYNAFRVLEKNNISLHSINKAAIEEALQQVHSDNKPVKDLIISRGRFPDLSKDAEVNYLVDLKKIEDNTYSCTEKVRKDQVILRKQPALKAILPGLNVHGERIESERPKDIELIAGDNVHITEDGLEVVSETRGILEVVVNHTYKENIKSRIIVSVEPIEVIDGSETIRITVDRPVEIIGDLKSGSKIISRRDVNISGNIEENTTIQTSSNIFIDGNIIGSGISCEQDFEADNVKLSKIMAEGKLVIKGTAMNSELIGHEVYICEVIGCNISAGKKIEIDSIHVNEFGFTAKLTAGIANHLEEIIKENVKFIVFADTNLEKLQKVFGEEIVDAANHENIAQMMMIHAENLDKMGHGISSSKQKEAIRQLISTIAPIRELRKEKSTSILDLETKKTKDVSTLPQIIIKEQVDQPVEVHMDGNNGEILPEDGGIVMEIKNDKIVKTPFEDTT